MKNISLALLAVVLAAILVFGTVLAAEGGVPWAHGLSGREFGQAVSELAQSEPGAVAEHIQANKDGDKGGGMPAAHGMSGREFGAAVSELAKSEPGAVADHVRQNKDGDKDKDKDGDKDKDKDKDKDGDKGGGVPKAHEMSGREFGDAVSDLAHSEPGAVAEHVRPDK